MAIPLKVLMAMTPDERHAALLSFTPELLAIHLDMMSQEERAIEMARLSNTGDDTLSHGVLAMEEKGLCEDYREGREDHLREEVRVRTRVSREVRDGATPERVASKLPRFSPLNSPVSQASANQHINTSTHD